MTINTNPSTPEEPSSAPQQNDVVDEQNGTEQLPLQVRIENALNGDEFNQQLERYGFSSTSEVAGFSSLSDLCETAQTKGRSLADDSLPTYEFYREAKQRAIQAENVMRDAVASQDPVSQALRHVQPPSLPESVTRTLAQEPIRFAKPESIQSSQSPAAYLKHIYDLATQKITPDNNIFGLNTRRPDLKNLQLSEDNLHQQITTLELVNEVLLAQLTDSSNNSESVFNLFKTQLHPLALPFDRNIASIRTGLAQMNDMSVNEITRRISSDYALKQTNFTLVPIPKDALNLLQSEVDILISTDSDDNRFKQIFGDSIDKAKLKIVDYFIAATDISFDEFRQLYRDGKAISDEAGNLYESSVYGATFFTDKSLRLSLNQAKQLEMHSTESQSEKRTEFSLDTFFAMNHLIRLYKRTGLAFHELNWLLSAVPGAKDNKKLTDLGFNVLAHYLYWRKHYNLSVDQFVGVLGEVNGYRRLGEQETTLMRQLFGENAAQVTKSVLANKIKLSDVDSQKENDISLGDILRRGLKLSQVEWTVIIQQIDSNNTLNKNTLACLYRMATLFPLLGWNVLSGIELIRKIDSGMLNTLKTQPSSSNTEALLKVMDKLAWLSQWMKTANFSVTELLVVLTPPEEAVLLDTRTVSNWLDEFLQAMITHLVYESDLAPYSEWIHANSLYSKLIDKGVLNYAGLVNRNTNIHDALFRIRIELQAPDNLKLQHLLIEQIEQSGINQELALANHIVQLTDNGNPEVIPFLLSWMRTDAVTVLNTLILQISPAKYLPLIYNLGRHLTVISKLSLDVATVAMVVSFPLSLSRGMTTPLSLEQVYYLELFKHLQNAEVSPNHWLSYFEKMEKEGDLSGTDENKAILAQLLDWRKEDIAPFFMFTSGIPWDVQGANKCAQAIQLCRDLSLSGDDLVSLLVNDPLPRAVLAALNRYQDGAQVAAAKNALNEQIRDALVAAYRSSTKVANNPTLKNFIKDEETLYEYLLLDVNVSSAVPTSRLVEANSSVQLYINRMLEGVEEANFPDKEALNDEWETAQQYRVWEANEKLKLHPSNYIEPELRFTKTELFKQFEQSLAQGYLNEDIIETALYSYMQELQQLTELQPKGFFHIRSVHYIDYYFTAKTSWSHLTYYYRHLRLDLELLKSESPQACQWGEWKRIDLPAVNEIVYGIYPAYVWNRLFLLWFEVEEKRRPDGKTTQYFLRLRYMRQKVDGSFDEAWNIEGTQIELNEITGLESLIGQLTVYQAYYDAGTIKQFFVVNDQQYRLKITQNTVDVNIDNQVSLFASSSVTGYGSTQNIFIGDTAQLWLTQTGIYIPTHVEVNSRVPFFEEAIIAASVGGNLIATALVAEGVRYNGFTLLISADVPISFDTIEGKSTRLKLCFPQINISCSTAVFLGEPIFVLKDSKVDFYLNGALNYSLILAASPLKNGRAIIEAWNHEIELIDIKGKIEVKLLLGYELTFPPFNFFDMKIVQPQAINLKESIDYRIAEATTDLLFYESAGTLKNEAYLVCRGATDKDSQHIIHLVSPALRNVPESLPIPSHITTLFSTVHQAYAEQGVDNFLTQVTTLGAIANPKPKNRFDFDGAFGLYGWEVFFHIPALIASKYAENGDYDAAKRWMKCIYNPSAQGNVWGVLPLISSSNNGSRSITDPDNVALKNPIQYQLAIIRQHLEHLLAEGDDYYRQQTQETLQQAKMCYVIAKNLFSEELRQQIEVLIAVDWKNPTLETVKAENFRPPYNEEILKLHQTFEKRLHNLRHWLTIDGEPLNIPLLASPIDPRQLQVAALAGVAATQAQFMSKMTLPYSFDTILAKAQTYTQQLMNFASSLQVALEKRDERALEELTHIQQKNLLDLVYCTQKQQIDIAKKAKEALEKAKATLQTEYEGQSKLADEYMNDSEVAASVLLAARTGFLVASSACHAGAGFAGLIPTIFGVAFGGTKGEKPLEGNAEMLKNSADMMADMMDAAKDAGAYQRRQQTDQLRRDVLSKELEEINVRIEEAELIINQEKNKLKEIECQQDHNAQLVDFMQRRFTNQQFYEWYVSRLSNLYSAAYDATVRFALMAERAFQSETEDFTATFIHPQWDRRYKGLLAGQALWVDLERMDLAYMSRQKPKQVLSKTISLRDLDETALKSLKARGEAVFFLNESLFDSDYPEHYGRRIQGIRVSFPALKEKGITPCGQLTQLSSRSYHSPQRDDKNAVADLVANQSIILGGCETDSRQLTMPQGRLLPFQGTGVESTWHLSFPAATKAVREKQITFPQKAVLDELDDVVIEISYSAQV